MVPGMTILLSALLAWFVVNVVFVTFMVRASRAGRSELERPALERSSPTSVVERSFGSPTSVVERSFGSATFSQDSGIGELRARR
jgi:hypothetical protein